jgi:ABC-type nickel/cobalt efflux system permease component RcnA
MSPILSLFLTALPIASARASGGQTGNLFLARLPYIAWHTSIVAVVVAGLALLGYGYRKRQIESKKMKIILVVNVLLVLWGVFVLWFASVLYSDLIRWSADHGALLFSDYLEYWTWGLKAVLWIGSGLLLTVTSLKEIVTRRRGSGC